jgi:hypothetical protein
MVSLNSKEYVILFLNKEDNGYTLIDLDHGKVSVPKNAARNFNARGKAGLSDEFSNLFENSYPNIVGEGIQCIG